MASKTHLQGQAGVYAVCAQLCLRGLTPCMPAVDDGVDLMLTNGLKLQIKSGMLRTQPGFPFGAYCFDVRKGWKRKGKEIITNLRERTYEGIADFVVFFGVDEQRFFVIPPSELNQSYWIPSKAQTQRRLLRQRNLKILGFEDAWHLLDVDNALSLIESESDDVTEKETL